MRIIHRLSVASSARVRADLAVAGVDVPATGLVTFEIDETDPGWPAVAAWVGSSRPLDVVRTEFTQAEVDAAAWQELQPSWHHGYPQPDEARFGYRAATYDLSDWCERCGSGLRQRAPFQLKAEPRWGGRGLLQLNWVFDEYFCTPAIWRDVFEPHGVSSRPVLGRDGSELSTVVQLVVGEPVPVAVSGLPANDCPRCHRTIHLPVQAGPFPALAGDPVGPLVRTSDYFGDGAKAFRPVLVRSDLAKTLGRAKGVTLRPVRPSSPPVGKLPA